MAIAELGVNLVANTSSFNQTMKQVSKQMKTIGKGFSDLGGQITKLTAPLAVIGASAIKSGLEFEKAYKKIRIGTGATGESLQGLQKDFQEVFKGVPNSAEEVSTAIADLNTRTGLSGDALQDLAKKTLDLSRITGEDLGGVIQSTTRLFGDWGIEAEKGGDTLDYLFKVSQSTGIGINDLSSKMVAFGAPLRNMGFDFETSAVLMGKFEKEGVNLELVMGSLRQAMGKFAESGITANVGLKEVFDRIKNAKDTTEATSIAFEVFGRRAGGDMADAIRGGRFEIDELLASLKESPETIAKAANETDGFAEKLLKLKNSSMVALEPIGTLILDNLIPIFEKLAEKIQILGDWFAGLSEKTQGLVTGMGLLAIATGPVLIIVGKLITSFGALYPLILTTSKAVVILAGASGIGLLAIALAGVATALYVFRDDVAKVFNYLFEQIEKLLSYIPLLNKLTGSLGAVTREQNALEASTNKLRAETENFIDSIAKQENGLQKLQKGEANLTTQTEKTRESLKRLKDQGLENTDTYKQQITQLQNLNSAKTITANKIKELSTVTSKSTEETKKDTASKKDDIKVTSELSSKVDDLISGKKGSAGASAEEKKAAKELEKANKELEASYEKLEEAITGKTEKAIKAHLDQLKEIIRLNPHVPIAELADQFEEVYNSALKAGVPVDQLLSRIEEHRKDQDDGDGNSFLESLFGKDSILMGGEFGDQMGKGIAEQAGQALSSGLSSALNQAMNDGDIRGAIQSLGSTLGSGLGTAVGSAFGGPLGGALGGALGQMIGDKAGKLLSDIGSSTKKSLEGLGFVMGGIVGLGYAKAFNKVFGGGTNKEANARDALAGMFNEMIKQSKELGVEMEKFNTFGRNAFNEFTNSAGESTTKVSEMFRSLSAEQQENFSNLGHALSAVFDIADLDSGQFGELLAANFGMGANSLNDLQLILQSTGLDAEQVGKQIEDAYSRGDIQAGQFLGAQSSIQDLFAKGIPGAIGATNVALQNYIDKGLVSGAHSMDSLGDMGSEAMEVLDDAGNQIIKTLDDLRGHLLGQGFDLQTLDMIFSQFARNGITSIQGLADITLQQTAQITAGLQGMGFGFSDVADDIDALSQKLDKIQSKKIDIEVNVKYNTKGNPPPADILANAKGNAFDAGNVMKFAKGGVVSNPTLFPMSKGAGLMGEAGPEAIIPLTRKSNGDLGIETEGISSGSIINVNIDAKGAEIGFAKRIRQEMENFFETRNDLIGARI